MPKGIRLTKDYFVQIAKQSHGDKYDYSKAVIERGNTKVCIICPIHGEFWQDRRTHMEGCGCPKCKGVARKTTQEWVEEASRVHNYKYRYPNAHYVNVNSWIDIECPQHGVFRQRAKVHLSGCGCPICKGENHKEVLPDGAINDCIMGSGTEAYYKWRAMLDRCYNPATHKVSPSYIDVTVCEEWHKFSNFKKWFDDPNNGYKEGYHLDKDIINRDARIYSPETCCFVPQRINCMLVMGKKSKDVCCPNGVRKHRHKFTAVFDKRYLGIFDTIDEAFDVYKKAKESHIAEVATEYYHRGDITKRVYDALLNFEIRYAV